MRRDIFEQIKTIVRDQTEEVGDLISNLHGVVETAEIKIAEEKSHSWYALMVDASKMPSLSELKNYYTLEMSGLTTVGGQEGVSFYPPVGGVPANRAVALLSVVNLTSSRQVPLQVSAPGAEISVYIDGSRVGSGVGTLKISPQVAPGGHGVTIIVYGATEQVRVTAARDVEFSSDLSVPEAPTLASIDFFYLDPKSGSLINRLKWNNSIDATSWGVYRAGTANLGVIKNTVFTIDDQVKLQVSGVWDVSAGETVLTEYFVGGTVVSVDNTLLDGSGNPYTEFVIEPAPEAPFVDTADWDGRKYFRPEDFHSLGTITYSGEAVIQYDDTAVTPGAIYIYKVTAFGLMAGLQESEYSSASWIFTNDEEPPQGIDATAVPTTETVGRRITVSFTGPPEPDFAGVRVYGPYLSDPAVSPPAAFSPALQVHEKDGHASVTDQISWQVEDGQADCYFYIATYDVFGNEQRPSAWIDERTGEAFSAAYFLPYDGPNDSSFRTNAAIELSVTTDPADPESMVHDVGCLVWPKTADFFAFLNGVPLDTTSDPSLTGPTFPAPAVGEEEYALYTLTIERTPDLDQRFLATAKGTGIRPVTVPYTIDRDDAPGLSGTSVESRVKRPVIRATMDDDARYLRLLDSLSAVVWDATKTLDAGYDQTGVITLVWTRSTDMAVDTTEAYSIEASKDGVTWTKVWEGEIQGPPPNTNTHPPLVWFEVLNPTTSTVYDMVVRVHAENRDADGSNLKLLYRTGSQGAWTTGYDGVATTAFVDRTIERSPQYHTDIVLFARAEVNGLFSEAHYIADFDTHPEIVGFTAHPLFDADGAQKGWRLEGVVDDDTKSVTLSFGNDVSFVAQTLTSGEVLVGGETTVTVNTTTFKSISIECAQPVGGTDTFEAIPYDAATPATAIETGEVFKVPLVIAPVSEISWQDLAADKVKIVVQAQPTEAIIKYRTYTVGGTKPAFSDTSLDATSSRLEKIAYRDVGGNDLIFEWFAIVGTNSEAPRTLTIDHDRLPEITTFEMVQDQNQNIVRVKVFEHDDDCFSWKLWARRGAQPTEDGSLNSDPLDDFLRFEGPVSKKNVFHNASAPVGGSATWYFLARAESYGGKTGPVIGFTLLINDVTNAPENPALESVTLQKNVIADELTISWTATASVSGSAAGAYECRVYSRINNGVWFPVGTPDPSLVSSIVDSRPMSDSGVTTTYTAKVELWTGAGVLLDTYLRATEYYDNGDSGKTGDV